VWESTVNGRQLHFHLAGINNQNFIMRDEETGSWWQQVTGEAIFGPLKGQKLREVFHDEVTFALWKQEQPHGRVLKPDPTLPSDKYAPADWEQRVSKAPVRIAQTLDQKLSPRAIVVGVTLRDASMAYPFEALLKQGPIIDELGGVPFVIVLGHDGKSVRAYERVVDGRKLEFFAKKDSLQTILIDAETGTEWDFTGKAMSGQLGGKQLKQVPVLLDYWFDWKNYHPTTFVYDWETSSL
jgi:hypothetical protein